MSLAMLGGLPAAALAQQQAAQAKTTAPLDKKAHTSAQDFEAVFLGSMFQQMYNGIKGDGPFGGSQGVGVWRSFLTDQYAKSIAKAGGIGIADKVYHALLAQQEAPKAARMPSGTP